jgi:NDP-sugar pyrophosphorylase family protein
VLAENHRQTNLEKTLKKLRPQSEVFYVPAHSEGPGRALLSIKDKLNTDQSVIVSYCDFGMKWDANDFLRFVEQTESDCCLVSYSGYHAHYVTETPYAYSRVENNRVIEIKEKGWFQDREKEYASNGIYYFKTGKLLLKALDLQFSEKNFINGESYTSLTVQSLMKANPETFVTVYEIPAFYQWGTPEDLSDYCYWEKTFENYFKKRPKIQMAHILVPMAGMGKRFRQTTDVPKPFLKIDGSPIYQRAVNCFDGKKLFVALEEHRKYLGGEESLFIEKTPEGQSLTTLAGALKLPMDREVFVTACDHEIVIDENVFEKAKTEADAVIFTVTGYPGSRRNSESYAYVNAEKNGQVVSVSCKKTISDSPTADPLLVGSFWFKSNQILQKGIELQTAKNLRANGELYLDLVFNCLIEAGKTVKICPLKSYINWGDPQAMSEALYWYEVFGGRSLTKRNRFSGVISDGI